jgi:type III pantothenate kinase
MLLAIDVGNTNITLGVFKEEELITSFRMMSNASRTSDEIGVTISDLLKSNQIGKNDLQGVIIASVVPNLMHALKGAIRRYFGIEPLVVGPGIKTGIKLTNDNPKELGADRIVDAVAAYEIYGGPILIIDFGTATTYDLVTENGEFGIGITVPGIRISANALWEKAAKLPEIEIKKPKSILAKDTVTSMQAGLVYGQIGQTEYIVNQVKKETGYKDLMVIATGGLGRIIAEETDVIKVYDTTLTLNGLRILYYKNRKQDK